MKYEYITTTQAMSTRTIRQQQYADDVAFYTVMTGGGYQHLDNCIKLGLAMTAETPVIDIERINAIVDY